MKKKFCYANHVLRTSDHDYKYAVVTQDSPVWDENEKIELISCHEEFLNACKAHDAYLKKCLKEMSFYRTSKEEKYVKALAKWESRYFNSRIVELEAR